MTPEERLHAERGRISALRSRIAQTEYMPIGPDPKREKATVCDHLQLSRTTVEAIPFPVLPWTSGTVGEAKDGKVSRILRRYHPADVAAYPARMRRYRDALARGEGGECLTQMWAELDARDAELIRAALDRLAA